MLVRCDQDRTAGQRRFRQDQGVVDLRFGNQFLPPQFARNRFDNPMLDRAKIQRTELPQANELLQGRGGQRTMARLSPYWVM
jgi:hypothetical protein